MVQVVRNRDRDQEKHQEQQQEQVKREIPHQLAPYAFQRLGDEPLSERVTLRLTPSLRNRVERYKAETGELPWQQVRDYLDEILPA